MLIIQINKQLRIVGHTYQYNWWICPFPIKKSSLSSRRPNETTQRISPRNVSNSSRSQVSTPLHCSLTKGKRKVTLSWYLTNHHARQGYSTFSNCYCNRYFVGFPLLFIIPSLLHTHLSPPHEVFDSLDQAAHYQDLGTNIGASSLSRNLTGLGENAPQFQTWHL
jgi:hypothetical protein